VILLADMDDGGLAGEDAGDVWLYVMFLSLTVVGSASTLLLDDPRALADRSAGKALWASAQGPALGCGASSSASA
jgi:hypothetical protein